MLHTYNQTRRKQAANLREYEYAREMAADDNLDDNFAHAEQEIDQEVDDIDDDIETEKMVDALSPDDSFVEEEIDRILESGNDRMTLDEIMGIN